MRSSSTARQHLGALVKLGPQVRLSFACHLVLLYGNCQQDTRSQLGVYAQGDGTCDHNPTERAINIITSLPYFALGLNTYRQALVLLLPSLPPDVVRSICHLKHTQ